MILGTDSFDHILIREGTIIVRLPKGVRQLAKDLPIKLFDVRSGVELPGIYPNPQEIELKRGYLLSDRDATAILNYRAASKKSKVVTILEAKQRKLDTVVADSILDQLKLIIETLGEFSEIADNAAPEQRLWLSQQVLPLLPKISGREISDLKDIVDWFKTRR
jgi:hypothetical protein